MATIHIDIETIPSQSPDVIQSFKDNVKPPATYSKPESIAKWLSEIKEWADSPNIIVMALGNKVLNFKTFKKGWYGRGEIG